MGFHVALLVAIVTIGTHQPLPVCEAPPVQPDRTKELIRDVYKDFYIKEAVRWLTFAEAVPENNEDAIACVMFCVEEGDLRFAEIGTSIEKMRSLQRKGYLANARHHLAYARGMAGDVDDHILRVYEYLRKADAQLYDIDSGRQDIIRILRRWIWVNQSNMKAWKELADKATNREEQNAYTTLYFESMARVNRTVNLVEKIPRQ